MEAKDILTAIGLFISLMLGILSIGISLANRRNTLREHLYEEQLSFYTKSIERLSFFAILLEDAAIDRTLKKEENSKKNLQLAFDQIQLLNLEVKKYTVICDNSVYIALINCHDIGLTFWTKFTANDTQWANLKIDFDEALKNTQAQIRQKMGINKLSEENQQLVKEKKSIIETELFSDAMKKTIELISKFN